MTVSLEKEDVVIGATRREERAKEMTKLHKAGKVWERLEDLEHANKGNKGIEFSDPTCKVVHRA